MTNVLRTGGGRMAAVVLLLDLSKGLLAVLLAREVVGFHCWGGGRRAAGLGGAQLAGAPGVPGRPGDSHRAGGIVGHGPHRRRPGRRDVRAGGFVEPIPVAGVYHRSHYRSGGFAGIGLAGHVFHHLRLVRCHWRRHHHLAAPGQHPTAAARHGTAAGSAGDED